MSLRQRLQDSERLPESYAEAQGATGRRVEQDKIRVSSARLLEDVQSGTSSEVLQQRDDGVPTDGQEFFRIGNPRTGVSHQHRSHGERVHV